MVMSSDYDHHLVMSDVGPMVTFPSEQPGPVSEFKPQKMTKDSVTLGWKKPISDGGSHITSYILEQSEGEEKWKLLEKGKNMYHTVGELTEGKEYSFRVKALNESGEGPLSELTIVAKDQIGKIFSVNQSFILRIIIDD